MFCKYCGNKVEEYHKHCRLCGALANHDKPASNSYAHYNDFNVENLKLKRQMEIQKINFTISYFSVNQRMYDEYDNSARDINELNRINAKMALIWSIILFAVSFYGLLLSMSSYYYDVNYYMNQFLICAPISGGLLFMFFSLNRRRRARLESAISKYCYNLTYLSNHYKNYKNCPVSIEYSNPTNLKAIKKVIESGRANSITEALNILLAVSQRKLKKDPTGIASEYLISKSIIHYGSAVFRSGKFFVG